MFLVQLKILNGPTIIREINFHKGLNLIVDETPNVFPRTATGNSVGKTTVLRLVDYCFGGDGKNIYQDTEFKGQPNTLVEDFLKSNDIIIEVQLAGEIDNSTGGRITIRKNFQKNSKKLQEINGENIKNNHDFDAKLKELIFHTTVDRPTFKQIISKNVRDEKHKMTNIVKVLSSFATAEVYEALYLFWLGIDTNKLDQKQKLSERKKREESFQRRLKKEGELSLVQQQLNFINGKIEELTERKKLFVVNENYSQDIQSLNETKNNLNSLSTTLSRLETRRSLIAESKNELQKEHAQVDVSQIKQLYERARLLIPNLQKTFEETIRFHNDLLEEKLKYITRELPDLEAQITRVRHQLNSLQREEKLLAKKIEKSGFTEELEAIIVEYNVLSERKGRLEEQKRLWESSLGKLGTIDEELKTLNDEIVSKDEFIQKRIATFNIYFSELSNQLYDEYYLLSSQKTEKGYDLVVTNIEGNPSTGKKKGQIAAFDFAYIKFADALDIDCLHFVMHDQLESIHDNQLITIIDVANQLNGQYIVPILRDKIPDNIDVQSYEVVSLSQTDKLFRM